MRLVVSGACIIVVPGVHGIIGINQVVSGENVSVELFKDVICE